jgi:hypothetical protein
VAKAQQLTKPVRPANRETALARAAARAMPNRHFDATSGGPIFDLASITIEPPRLPLQRKLAIGASDDPLEREADRVADAVARSPGPVPAVASAVVPQVARKCACGATAGISGECSECEKKTEGKLQRRATAAGGSETAPPLVHEVLRSPGAPLDAATRGFFERRLRPVAGRHDFSRIRVHTGPQAAEAARSVDAHAFALGRDIVFGDGQYAPHTAAGRHLIAHELTHVVQQASAAGPAWIQRASIGLDILRTLRDIAFFIPSLFGAEISYGDDELLEYLDGISQNDRIEGGYYSDDKARQIVSRWKAGNAKFRLDAQKKKLLIREMQDGIVTDGDREGILTLLENTSAQELGVLLSPANIDFAQLLKDLNSGAYAGRVSLWFFRHVELHQDLIRDQFAHWFAVENFDGDQRALAEKVVLDMLAVKSGLDFADEGEFKAEVVKRVRISSLMTESQAARNGFDYPTSMTAASGCPDYKPPAPGEKVTLANARVNKAARAYWTTVQFGGGPSFYYFDLTAEGKENAYKALTTLFEPQDSICDKTLIHCDYLVNVIQFRTYAESLGVDRFNSYVKSGRIHVRLTYTGFPLDTWDPRSPKALGYMQHVRPASKQDLLIGDHVTFWNHLAFDGLNVKQGSDWRLENAVLTDKNDAGADLFQGHGSGPPMTEHGMLNEMAEQYNALARAAIAITDRIEHGTPEEKAQAETSRQSEYPWVVKEVGKWVVVDPGRQAARSGWRYELQLANEVTPESDVLLPGLLDPLNRSQLGEVDRPIESAPGRAPAA